MIFPTGVEYMEVFPFMDAQPKIYFITFHEGWSFPLHNEGRQKLQFTTLYKTYYVANKEELF
jgi:hypothetical protein